MSSALEAARAAHRRQQAAVDEIIAAAKIPHDQLVAGVLAHARQQSAARAAARSATAAASHPSTLARDLARFLDEGLPLPDAAAAAGTSLNYAYKLRRRLQSGSTGIPFRGTARGWQDGRKRDGR